MLSLMLLLFLPVLHQSLLKNRKHFSPKYIKDDCTLSAATLLLSDKDGKAFHPTYEEKLRLVALHKQVLLGPYNPDASPDVGFFDVLGNDRR